MSSFVSAEQMGLLFKNSSDAVFFMEKIEGQYRYLYVNEAAIQLIKVNPLGEYIEQIIPSHLAKTIIQYYNLTLKDKKQLEYEDYTYENFKVLKQRTTTMPVLQDEKNYILAITKVVSVNRDLEDKYLFMRSLFSKSYLSTLLVSNDMQLLEANPQFIEEFSIQLGNGGENNLFELPFIDSKNAAELKSYLLRAQNGESIHSKLLYFIDKKMERRCYTATFSSLLSNGVIIAVFIVLQEITAFMKQNKALQTASHGVEMFKKAIFSVADVIFTDANGVIIDINERVIKNTGYRREEVCNRKKNGEIYWVDSTILPLKNEHGEIEQFLTVQYNISAEKQLLSELYKVERIFLAITENTNDFIVVTDRLGIIKYASPSYCRKLGYKEDKLVGIPYDQLLMPESRPVWKDAIHQNAANLVGEKKIELQLYTEDSKPIWTEGNFTMSLDLAHQAVSEIVMVSREITERKELENELTYLAYHDSLTQLGNRRKLVKEFSLLVKDAETSETSLAIFYLDGDNFKQVNDAYGHDVGDEFLIQFSRALLQSVRQEDSIYRLGGDEFLIVFTELSSHENERIFQIEKIMERIKEQLQIGWTIRGVHFSPTVSIGISMYPQHSRNLDELVDLADQALYQAKRSSRNQYCISGAK